MNQMMGSTATSMSTMFKKKIDIAPPQVSRVDFTTDATVASIANNDEPLVRVAFKMEVENLIDSEIMQLVTFDVAKELAENLLEAVQPQSAPKPVPTARQPQAAATLSQPSATPKSHSKLSEIRQSPLSRRQMLRFSRSSLPHLNLLPCH
jgi:flagellar motor switch protein FliN/FliY